MRNGYTNNIVIANLPERISVKNPSNYTKTECLKILAVKDDLDVQ